MTNSFILPERIRFELGRLYITPAVETHYRAAQTGYSRRRDGRTQPVMTSQRQTNGCHHGRRGVNCAGRPSACQNCNGWVTRRK